MKNNRIPIPGIDTDARWGFSKTRGSSVPELCCGCAKPKTCKVHARNLEYFFGNVYAQASFN